MVSSGALPNHPEFVVHRIKEISSTRHNFTNILEWFKLAGKTKGSKRFLIDKIDNHKDILIFGEDESRTRFYYKDHSNNIFMSEIKNRIEPIIFKKIMNDSNEEKKYQEAIHIAQVLYPQQKLTMEKGITAEQIKKVENVVAQQYEKQKERQKNFAKKQQLLQNILTEQHEK